MKEYNTPEIEFVELEDTDVIVTSSYVCPNAYGNTCKDNPYGGN